MIKECPKHKSSENMLKNLTNRLKKLKRGAEKQRKAGKSNQQGIKKADMQCILAGFPNTGKSSIFKKFTGLSTSISTHAFTTNKPKLGTFEFENTKIQIIDTPSFPNHDKSLLNSTDTIILVIDEIEQIKKAEDFLYRAIGKIIIIYNKIDLLNEKERRKIRSTLKSKFKKYDFYLFSENSTKLETKKLKQKIFETFPIIRVFTKEPKKDATKEPMILKEFSTLRDVAEKILKGMSKKIKRTRIWGPSSKFGGQSVGLEHVLKDKDTVEFKLK